MIRQRSRFLAGALALVAMTAAGCSSSRTTEEASSAPAESAAAESPAATAAASSEAAASSKFGEVLETLETTLSEAGSASDVDWLQWDEASCSFTPAAEHPDSYSVELRDGTDSGVEFVWTPEDQVFDTLIVANKSFEDYAASSNNVIPLIDNGYPDTERPLIAADEVVQRDPAVVVSMNVLADLNPAIMQKYKEACIPAIAHSVPAEGQPFFGGGDWSASGAAQAAYLVGKAQEQGWTPETASVVLCSDSAFEQSETSPYGAILAFRDYLASNFPVAEDRIYEIQCPSDGTTDTANTADWLTAHPDDNQLIMFGLNDIRALGMANALRDADRSDQAVLGGVGLSAESVKPICDGDTTFLSSVDFVPQLWGAYGIGMAQDIADGKPIPAQTYPVATVVDSSNIDQALCAK